MYDQTNVKSNFFYFLKFNDQSSVTSEMASNTESDSVCFDKGTDMKHRTQTRQVSR